jgi:hypothetical protein
LKNNLPNDVMPGRTVQISNLARTVTGNLAKLIAVFGKFGSIIKTDVRPEQHCAFIEYALDASAQAAAASTKSWPFPQQKERPSALVDVVVSVLLVRAARADYSWSWTDCNTFKSDGVGPILVRCILFCHTVSFVSPSFSPFFSAPSLPAFLPPVFRPARFFDVLCSGYHY